MASRGNTLTYFMWGYQPHFQGAIQSIAERTLQALDPRLEPHVFLVGFLEDERPDCHPICIEPEDCGFRPQDFEGVLQDANSLLEADEESRIIHSMQVAQENHDRRVKRKSLRAALEQRLQALDVEQAFVWYASMPTKVGAFQVQVVLRLQRSVFESHYHLSLNSQGRYRLPRSLLDATILQYLHECSDSLLRPDAGADLLMGHKQYSHLLRDGAETFILRIANTVARYGEAGSLYERLNAISAMFYERAEGKGILLLSERNHPGVSAEIALLEPVQLRDHRAARKLVEVSSRGIGLLCDGEHIYGLGNPTPGYDSDGEDLFEIRFTAHYGWSVFHRGQLMMRVAYNEPQPLLPRLNSNKLRSDLQRIFPTMTDDSRTRLLEIARGAIELGHGTQLVITADAAQEALRLAPQATSISPIRLTPELLPMLCAIDGAVLLDPGGDCHAVGVILDGLVSPKGDRSRGSRYNSAVRFAHAKDNCLVVVISDDNTVDIVPDLRPQLSRRKIEEAIRRLEIVVEENNEEDREYNRLMSWLSDHRFYLSQAQCVTVNDIRATVEARRVMEVGCIYVVYQDLEPDSEMNDFFLSE